MIQTKQVRPRQNGDEKNAARDYHSIAGDEPRDKAALTHCAS